VSHSIAVRHAFERGSMCERNAIRRQPHFAVTRCSSERQVTPGRMADEGEVVQVQSPILERWEVVDRGRHVGKRHRVAAALTPADPPSRSARFWRCGP
jgi:hypothetical protein